jgi:hypothetical protein
MESAAVVDAFSALAINVNQIRKLKIRRSEKQVT